MNAAIYAIYELRRLRQLRVASFALTVWVVLIFVTPPHVAAQQREPLRIDYTVKVESFKDHLFHVTADVRNIRQPRLDLSLPTWAPGWYTVENYAKNILRFEIKDARGRRLPHSMTHKQTWRVATAGLDRVKVEFDYRANVLALNQAKITDEWAFFTGIELFLLAEGHRNSPATVRFDVPDNWKIVSALKETRNAKVFTAPDYDTLVDAPTEMGNFDVLNFDVEGKPHTFVSTPAGAFPKDQNAHLADFLTRLALVQRNIFGELPYEKYVYFYFFAPPESNAGGGLEHLNSHVVVGAGGQNVKAEFLTGIASHEFFHLWNVKRLRPAEMWPYDYSREQESPLLWFSEGFTNYYGALAEYRAGTMTRPRFLEIVGGAAGGVESNEARKYISPADSSTSTWLGYDTPKAFSISYYTQGQNLGALLDLSIRQDTAGVRSLDDVMLTLYQEFYKRGRGFTNEDVIAVINRLTRRDYRDFFRRHITGVEVPPYDKIFGYAGYRFQKLTEQAPRFGISFNPTPEGAQVTNVLPDSPAAAAGLVSGDLIRTIDDTVVKPDATGNVSFRDLLAKKIGQTVKLSIKRGTEERTLDVKVGTREETNYRLVELPRPTAAQLKIREGWLARAGN
ncbi:MAG TPA: PDZ domain-containing protein [Pyrinomonadaceae bacterium]|jgi:predicted metalloprotease with PDZ domain|nr:PDZ domain-containing protein [Pyrinomonadaceae bacterium]